MYNHLINWDFRTKKCNVHISYSHHPSIVFWALLRERNGCCGFELVSDNANMISTKPNGRCSINNKSSEKGIGAKLYALGENMTDRPTNRLTDQPTNQPTGRADRCIGKFRFPKQACTLLFLFSSYSTAVQYHFSITTKEQNNSNTCVHSWRIGWLICQRLFKSPLFSSI